MSLFSCDDDDDEDDDDDDDDDVDCDICDDDDDDDDDDDICDSCEFVTLWQSSSVSWCLGALGEGHCVGRVLGRTFWARALRDHSVGKVVLRT